MKRLWLIGILLLVLLGFVLARHAGVPSFISGNGAASQQEQTTSADSGTAGENAPAPDAARPSAPEQDAASHPDSSPQDSSSPEKAAGASAAGQTAQGADAGTADAVDAANADAANADDASAADADAADAGAAPGEAVVRGTFEKAILSAKFWKTPEVRGCSSMSAPPVRFFPCVLSVRDSLMSL